MTDCIATGWGSGAWGSTPWGGEPASPGGPLPTNPPFDVYCVGPCGPMSVILTYPDVQAVETGTQFFVDGTTLDLGIASGGEVPTSAAQLYITSPVPGSFTVDWTMYLASLPLNFADVPHKHVYFSVCNISGSVAGLLFSRAGIAYTGSAHVDVAGDLILDGPLQPLPDSQDVIEEGSYFTIRIVVDAVTGVTYVYVTRTSELETYGHRLRYVLPRLASDTMRQTPVEGTMVSVRGGVDDPSRVFLDSICLGTGLVIPNIAPRAVAGSDQAIRACSVLRLDGSASFDPEGSPLTYQWRLVDAPLRSQYVFEGRDGSTVPLPIPTGFTDKFYTPSLAAVHGMDPLTPGDVLLIRGLSYILHSVGSDGGGFFVRIEGFSLPEDIAAGEPFSLLRQRGISGATQAKPTFYPDVPGLYRFALVVFDGVLLSEPSVVVVNVTETATPRGVVPDATFVWDYLSTFWQLVEGKERIDTVWSSIIQVASAELLSLWQIDYSKSLRDVQRTFQRRWLHYALELTETAFEKTSVRSVPSGVSSSVVVVAGTAGISGTTVVFRVRGEDYPVTFEGSPMLTAGEIGDQLQAALYRVDRRFRVLTILDRTNTMAAFRVQAPFGFSVDEGTSSLFASASSGIVQGSGTPVNPRTYCTDRTLNGEVAEGDLLVLVTAATASCAWWTTPQTPGAFSASSCPRTFPRMHPRLGPFQGTWTAPPSIWSLRLFMRGIPRTSRCGRKRPSTSRK